MLLVGWLGGWLGRSVRGHGCRFEYHVTPVYLSLLAIIHLCIHVCMLHVDVVVFRVVVASLPAYRHMHAVVCVIASGLA